MATHNLISEDPCIILWRISRLDGNKMSGFGQHIHNHPYRIMFLSCIWKPFHKINIYVFPLPSWNLDFLEYTTRLLMFIFHLLAIWTVCNKFRYVLLQALPPNHFFKVMIHLCRTCMNGIMRTISFLKNTVPQVINFWHTQPSLKRQASSRIRRITH